MAPKKTKSRRTASKSPAKQPQKAESKPVKAAAESSRTGAASQRRHRREVRPYVYAGFDLLTVIVWIILLSTALSNRHGWAAAFLWIMVVLVVVMGGAMLVRNRWGWRLAAVGCGGVLIMWVILVITMLMSAAFLSGVYGAFGRGAAMGTLVVAGLTIQVVALLPAFQLKFLMTRAGRRYFKQEPLWR